MSLVHKRLRYKMRLLDSDLEVGAATVIGYQLATPLSPSTLYDYEVYRKSSPSLTRALLTKNSPPPVALVDIALVEPSWSRCVCGPHGSVSRCPFDYRKQREPLPLRLPRAASRSTCGHLGQREPLLLRPSLPPPRPNHFPVPKPSTCKAGPMISDPRAATGTYGQGLVTALAQWPR